MSGPFLASDHKGVIAVRRVRRAQFLHYGPVSRIAGSILAAGVLAVFCLAIIDRVRAGHVVSVLAFIGATALMAGILTMLFPPGTRTEDRGRGPVTTSRASGQGLALPVPLSPAWAEDVAACTLADFLDCFDESLSSLRARLETGLPAGLGGSLPLHQEISIAEELKIWRPEEVRGWRACLSLRTAILTEGTSIPVPELADRAKWLREMSERTFPSRPGKIPGQSRLRQDS
jgi:hypothetical protein